MVSNAIASVARDVDEPDAADRRDLLAVEPQRRPPHDLQAELYCVIICVEVHTWQPIFQLIPT